MAPEPAERAAWDAATERPPLSAWRDTLPGPQVDVAALDRLFRAASARDGVPRPAVREQTPALLADGLHYESRIARDGVLATRSSGVHDLFNALIWLRHPALKWALNARQVADIERVGPRLRTRGQCALTHFDEAGAIVWIADEAVLACWDAHDWTGLFHRHADAWGRQVAVTVFGHALLEHAVRHAHRPTAKALVVRVGAARLAARGLAADALVGAWPEPEAALAQAIAECRLLADPQELRPLPLAGIPGWHLRPPPEAFYRTEACFRPLRPGRRYPPPFAC
ncbi:MAG TPA: DUF3025 domain-containing protein [Dokdonella sp.]|uniref:DUF3025 domain-containing protein n=1 Tax=Dokdonella sp. TaxID=2291710 RepID=UPI002BAF0CEC|nr:DUF3025 domain-containing protein [Dokdonella sp.]HUD43420.1 DUF3025 domain-containing protein [Dokdonella sp.]